MALAGTFDMTVSCYNGQLGLGTQVTVISRGDCTVKAVNVNHFRNSGVNRPIVHGRAQTTVA
jgi:hypothetical protein